MLLETIATGHTPMDMTDLNGKVAVIIGGASGIGLSLARRLKAEGMKLVLADFDREALDHAAGELGALGVLTDVRDPESLKALAEQAVARFGKVHLLCSNAGVVRMAGIERLTLQDWRWQFDVNLFGAVSAVEAFLPILKANPDGAHILFTASLSSLYPTRSQAAYGATKYALAAFGETLALELQAEDAKVGVTLLCPGPVRTNLGTSYAKREEQYQTPVAAPADSNPDIHEQAFRSAVVESDWMTSDQIADDALKGMRRGEMWVITHPDLMSSTLNRNKALAEAAQRAADA